MKKSSISRLKRAVYVFSIAATGILIIFILLSLCLDSAMDVAFAINGVTDRLVTRQAIIHSGFIACLYGIGAVVTMAWVLYFLIVEMTGPTPTQQSSSGNRIQKGIPAHSAVLRGERRGYLLIGFYRPETDEYVRAWYGQGYIYKDENAYRNHPAAVCYVPELSDARYTALDLFQMTGENKENHPLADRLFSCLDWQHPESQLSDKEFAEG